LLVLPIIRILLNRSEFIHNSNLRLGELSDFTRELIQGGNGKVLIELHKTILDTVTPTEAMQVLDQMLADGFSNEMVKTNVGKIINAFYKSLSAHQWEKPQENHSR